MIDQDEVATGEFEAVELDEEGNPIARRVPHEWLWTFERRIREMEARASFDVHQSEAHRPPPDVLKEHLMTASGLKVLPDTIVSFFDITDGYDLRWSRKDADGAWVPGGEARLFGFAEVFGKWINELWDVHGDDATKEEVDFTWELRGFDGADSNDDHIVVFHVPEVLPRYDLYWHEPRGRTYRLRVDFLEYLECLSETRGLCGWQYMVCDLEDLREDDEALERVRECTALMKDLFPEVDLSRYTTLEDD